MFKGIGRAVVLTLFLAVMVRGAYAYDNGDFQIWNSDVEDVKIHKDLKFSMEQEYRFGENATELYYQHYDFGFIYNVCKTLDIGLFYRLVMERYKKKWREEDVPNINATLKFDLWKFKLEDRNRIELRYARFRDDSVRYRNKATLKFPIDLPKQKIKISPYVSDEIFVVSTGAGCSENRFCAGAEFELTKYVKADLYYMMKDNRTTYEKWTSTNVLGTKVKIAF